jgi:hypothetical protein
LSRWATTEATVLSSQIQKEIYKLSVDERVPTRAIIMRYPNLSANTVRKYVSMAWRSSGLKIPPSPPSGELHRDRPALSPLHKRIGRAIIAARARENQTSDTFSRRTLLGTRVTFCLYEQGAHDYTLTELERIAALKGQTLRDFILEKTQQ